MTRNDLVALVAQETGISAQSATREVVDATFKVISRVLAQGESIEIRGFGSLKVLTSRSRPARLISENKSIMLPPRKRVKFIPGRELKKALQDI